MGKTRAKGKSEKATMVADPLVDPRQIAFLAAYTDPKSDLFGNALQSAIKAGYSHQYAESITAQMPAWLSENLGNDRRLKLAEQHLSEVLDMPIIDQAMGAFGPIFEKKITFEKVQLKNGKTKLKKIVQKVPVMVYMPSRIKEKTKVAEIALEAYDKATYGKKAGPKFSFTFNAKGARDRYDA